MEVIVAQSAGFCYGVNRAVEMCKAAAEEYDNCVTLGPVIHNSFVTADLEQRGVCVVQNISQINSDNTVIIRSHGAVREELDELDRTGAKIIDATCPDVRKIHEIVKKDSATGRFIIVIGERNHPEIKAICSWCSNVEGSGAVAVCETPQELENLFTGGRNKENPVSIVFQTTSTKPDFDKFVAIAKKMCTNQIIYDTICNATKRRQADAAEISKKADTVIIVGDKKSSNSKRLAEICKEHCRSVIFAQSAGDIDMSLLNGVQTIGITAGASTPAFIIKEVIAKMNNETTTNEEIVDGGTTQQENVTEVIETESAPVPESEAVSAPESEVAPAPESVQEPETAPVSDSSDEEESFEALLEKSIKTFNTGDKVEGIVTSITATEISVDLGAKQSGYIPVSEFIEDDNDIEDTIKVGDTIEAFITRVNDVEGMIILSKKRLDAIKNWDIVMAAKESREIVSGYVIQENRGGIVVNVKGVHVFVPASQTGLAKNTPMTELLKKNVKLRINEVNQSRRRVIGSIRDAQRDERRELSEKVWNDIEVGKQYDGVVKSMTSYGVFVDIGGVDGMIHISELSWTRIKQPSEVMSLGDEVSVYVISFDKESKKISLGYKKGEDNPWTKFTKDFKVDDVVSVKIVKMMPFGAFAEITPGVDGLIHISQIAEHRIGLPSEVLKEGQVVDVKITEIDNDRKKVSLSMRALIEPSEETEENTEETEENTEETEENTEETQEAAEEDTSAEAPETEATPE